MGKSIEELKSINTKNLLAYYKAVRKRFYNMGEVCECCHEFIWDLYKCHEEEKENYKKTENYLSLIKTELNSREHIEKNKNDKNLKNSSKIHSRSR